MGSRYWKRIFFNQAVLRKGFFLMASSFSVAAVNSEFAWANTQYFGCTSPNTLKRMQYITQEAGLIFILPEKSCSPYVIKFAQFKVNPFLSALFMLRCIVLGKALV